MALMFFPTTPEVPTAAPNPPEQVLVLSLAGGQEAAVWSHNALREEVGPKDRAYAHPSQPMPPPRVSSAIMILGRDHPHGCRQADELHTMS